VEKVRGGYAALFFKCIKEDCENAPAFVKRVKGRWVLATYGTGLTPQDLIDAGFPARIAEEFLGEQRATSARTDNGGSDAHGTEAADGNLWGYGLGLSAATALSESGQSVTRQEGSSATAGNTAARVDPVPEKSSAVRGGGHTVPKLQPIKLEASKLVLPPAPTMVVGGGGTSLAATGHSEAIARDGGGLQGVAGQSDRVSLKDGSALFGKMAEGKVPFKSSLGSIEVNANDIRSFADGKLRLADGTVLAGAFEGGMIEIAASVGALKVPADEIVGIGREGQRAAEGKEANE
jgi:hypothetical protein